MFELLLTPISMTPISMTPVPMTPSTSSRSDTKKASSPEGDNLANRLEQAGLPTDRAVPVEPGEKCSYNHTERPFDEVVGNHGVMAGRGLLIIDVDDYREGESLPDGIRALLDDYPTLVVASPHGGIHLYFIVPPDAPGRIEKATGRENPHIEAAEVRARNQYVLGPGSQLDGCGKDWCDNCWTPTGGSYTMLDPRPIAELPLDRLIEVLQSEVDDSPSVDPERDLPATQRPLHADEEEWLARAQDTDDYLDGLMAYFARDETAPEDFEPRYPDRSRNETALAEKLLWRFGGFEGGEGIVRRIMDDLRPPKWSRKGDGYKDSVLRAGRRYTTDRGDFYVQDGGGGVRKSVTFNIVLELGTRERVRTTDIVESRFVDVEEDQVRKVLDALDAEDHIHYETEGRRGYWVADRLPDSDSEFFDQFLDAQKILDQRREYLHGE